MGQLLLRGREEEDQRETLLPRAQRALGRPSDSLQACETFSAVGATPLPEWVGSLVLPGLLHTEMTWSLGGTALPGRSTPG